MRNRRLLILDLQIKEMETRRAPVSEPRAHGIGHNRRTEARYTHVHGLPSVPCIRPRFAVK